MFELLADPLLYTTQLERLIDKEHSRAPSLTLGPDGPAPSAVGLRADALARVLARTVGSGAYRFSCVQPRMAKLEGKLRTLHVFDGRDQLVLGALAAALGALLEPRLSEHVHSYRRGRSTARVVQSLLAFARAHRSARPDPRTRGLYVVRRDIKAYGEAIPSGADSALWSMLFDALSLAGQRCSTAEREWLMQAVRPRVREADGREHLPEVGVPTGSPLQPLMCNLYLGPIDRVGESVPDGFYARFGDDILFAHADAVQARAAMQRIDAEVHALGLQQSPEKCRTVFWNGAGRASPVAPDFRGTASFDYLGAQVDFHGATGLKAARVRSLLLGLRTRLRQASALLGDAGFDERARVLGAVAATALDPLQPVCEPSAQVLRYLVTDRPQLRDLDHKIAVLTAAAISGVHGPRALRHLPPRRLRAHGVPSLVAERNRIERARRAGR